MTVKIVVPTFGSFDGGNVRGGSEVTETNARPGPGPEQGPGDHAVYTRLQAPAASTA